MKRKHMHREKLFVYHLWQAGSFMGWAVMTEAEAYIETSKCAPQQRWLKVVLGLGVVKPTQEQL